MPLLSTTAQSRLIPFGLFFQNKSFVLMQGAFRCLRNNSRMSILQTEEEKKLAR